MKNSPTNKGFSLIEIIIYVAIFALLAGVVIDSFVVVMGSFSETRTYRDLQESGTTSMERMAREIRQAKSYSTSNSVFDVSPGTLELNYTDSSNVDHTVKFIYENYALNMYKDNLFSASLLNQNILPSSLIFRKFTTSAGSAIKIELTLQDNRGGAHKTASFYNTVILRSDY
jgi:prepilin-type N-terminal cleavage/methylation domain-containing protein